MCLRMRCSWTFPLIEQENLTEEERSKGQYATISLRSCCRKFLSIIDLQIQNGKLHKFKN